MLFSALVSCTAIWLLVTPYLGLETGPRAGVAVAVGIVALILAPLRITSSAARWATAALGLMLGLFNFGPGAPLLSLASLGTCAVLLVIGGIAPQPVAAPAPRVAEEITAKVVAPAPAARATRGPRTLGQALA